MEMVTMWGMLVEHESGPLRTLTGCTAEGGAPDAASATAGTAAAQIGGMRVKVLDNAS